MNYRAPLLIALAALALALLGASCQKGKITGDLKRICNAERLSGDKSKDRVAHQLAVSNWITEKLETETARRIYSDLFNRAPKARVVKLRAEAARAGVKNCALAASWERDLKEDGK